MAKQALAMDLDGDMYCKECGMFVWIAGVTFRNSWCKHIEACNHVFKLVRRRTTKGVVYSFWKCTKCGADRMTIGNEDPK
jgi:hypothetical protein